METQLESILTHSYKAQMLEFVKTHPECFEEMLELAIGDRSPYNWRAAWLTVDAMNENDYRILPKLNRYLKAIPTKTVSHQRELLRILYKMNLNENQEGKVFDIAMNLWKQPGLPPAVRYHAFRTILRIANTYPDLGHEIELVTRSEYLETLSPGVLHSIRRMFREFKNKLS